MNDPAPPSTPPIDYAPSTSRRGWWKRYLIIAVLILLGLWGTYKWRAIERLYATTQAYMWQRRAMRFTLPENTIVYSDDPAEISTLLKRPNYFSPASGGPVHYEPPPLRQMLGWRQIHDGAPSMGRNQSGGIFLHARMQSDGKKRLVAIAVFPFSPTGVNSRYLVLYGAAIQPGSLTHMWEAGTAIALLNIPLKPSDQVTIFAGRADSADASHFTIPFQINAESGVIDGWLRNSRIQLRPRGGDIKSDDQSTPMLIWPDGSTTAPAAND
jgi:hypothetical protein